MVSDEDIEKTLEVARWAPSDMNFQPWEFIVGKNPNIKKRIFKSIFRRPPRMPWGRVPTGRILKNMKQMARRMPMRGPNAPGPSAHEMPITISN